jgi:uncharacterized RDD family membrane protein YckC
MAAFERREYSDQLNIETPEQVELEFSIAGLGSRFVAILIDSVLIAGFYLAVFLVLALVFSSAMAAGGKAGDELDTAGKWVLAAFIFLNFLLVWGYFALFEGLWRGQTPGKRVMKLRVIKDSGRQITFFEALARNLLRFVDYLPGMYLVGVITMLCNKRNKRLGDLAAGTVVVHERLDEQPLLFQTSTTIVAPVSFGPQPFQQEQLAPWAKPAPVFFPAGSEARCAGPAGDRDILCAHARPAAGDASGDGLSHCRTTGGEVGPAAAGGQSGADHGVDCVPDARERADVVVRSKQLPTRRPACASES